MKKIMKYFMLTLVVSAFILGSCSTSDDDNPAPPAAPEKFDVLKDYMIANSMDVGTVIADWIVEAQNVNAKTPGDYFIIDLRSQADYDAGHIEGAVNSTLVDILTTAEAATKPILVACYTGQSAGHAVIALRLSGHSNAKVLKWGMSSWRDDLAGKWEDGTGDAAIGNTSWIVPPGEIAVNAEFDDPVIVSSFTEGAEILAERVDEMLANQFSGIDNGDVLGDPASYFINNYWALADVELYGNITGAYRLNPFTLTDKTYKNLDPSQTIVTYCWTGQTSSMLTAYLYILGYDATSLKFGANSMIYTNLLGHKWALQGNNFPVFPTK